jgi:DNA topoisomerase-3
MQLIVAEKPSVARDIARTLGVPARGSGAFRGDRHVITWCLGHLVELDEPASYDPAWKRWSLDTLPMLPERFKLRAVRSSFAQWKVVRELLRSRDFSEVVNACDAGREGELIFRLCYDLAGSRLPARRLWVSSLTDTALKSGFAKLRPAREYDPLAEAARCRSEADWLVGLNATRAFTVRNRGASSALLSIGRVQTPTLAMVVVRERAIRAFVPKDYWEVHAAFAVDPAREGEPAVFKARWSYGDRARLATEALARAIVERCAQCTTPESAPRVESLDTRTQKSPPPLLFDLTSLQRTANGRYGFSAQRTLDLAQSLYERHKVITYPRTDSRYLSRDIHAELPEVFDAVGAIGTYAPFVARLKKALPGMSPRVFNDARVSDHHAIIPTAKRPTSLDRDEERLYDLIVRRFLGVFYPDAEFEITTAVVHVGAVAGAKPPAKRADVKTDMFLDALPPAPDRFTARGRVRTVAGWQEVAGIRAEDAHEDEKPSRTAKEGDDDEERDEGKQALPTLAEGQRLRGRYRGEAKQTKPPKRYTEATLLAAMESAGREIEDDALRLAMKDSGLGTPATRASIIETLLKREYLTREQKTLVPTEMGMALIEKVPVEALTSPELTGSWEARLARMARGEEKREDFMRDIRAFVTDMIARIRTTAATPMPVSASYASHAAAPAARSRGKGRGRSPTKSAAPRTRAPRAKVERAPASTTSSPTVNPGSIHCPRCHQGTLITGRAAWGCSRWREGCRTVIPFEFAGKKLTETQARDLATKGVTRLATWEQNGASVRGRLRLDLGVDPAAVRLDAGG